MVSSSWIIPVIRSDDPPSGDDPFIYYYPPVNSFGMGVQKSVNPVFLKNLIQSNMDWGLFYKRYSYSSWTDGNEYLDINLSWNNSINAFKIKLTFIAPVDIFQAEFRMGFNVNVLDFIEKNDNEIWFNYSTTEGNINLMFNYSDLRDINGLYFDKGIVNDRFYFLFGRMNIPGPNVYVFDPIFGFNTEIAGVFTEPIAHYFDSHGTPTYHEYLWGFRFTATVNATIDNVSMYLNTITAIGSDINVSITNNSGYILANGEGTSNTITQNGDYWHTVNFTGTKPTVINGSQYYIFVIADADDLPLGGKISLHGQTTGSNYSTHSDEHYSYYPGWTEPISHPYQDISGEISMYCSYTVGSGGEGCVNETLIQTNSTTNGTTNINPCVTRNWTADVFSQCCDLIDFVNISCNGLYHNVTNGANGTYWLNITNLVCGTTYTVFVNASLCDDTINSSWFTFSTWNCCDTTIQGVDNTTLLNYDYNLTYVNLTDYGLCINSSCNTTLEYVNISVVGENYTNMSSVSEGCSLNINVTGLTLDCNTDYRVYINASSDNCSGNHYNMTWVWLNTSDCPVLECNCILSNENITNKTININNTADGYYNFTIDYNISCGNFTGAYLNITVLNMSHNVSISSNGTAYLNYTYNFSCNQNITWYVNLTSPNCNNFSTFWFRTVSCGAFPCNCSDFYTKDEIDVMLLLYVKKSDMMDLAIANSQLSILLTLVLFGFFFYVGYNTNRKSGGAFVMFSGFIFIGLSLLIGSYLNAIYVTPLLLPFAGFIILIGVKKWLYEDSNKTEG